MSGYGTDEAFADWLTSNGFTLPQGAPSPAILRQRGSDYLDATYAGRLTCSSPSGGFEQERAWPRSGHVAGSQAFPSDVIPAAWVRASYRAAWLEANTPGWTTASIDPNRRTKREKADVLEREFFAPSETGTRESLGNVDSVIDGMVAPLLCIDGSLGLWAIGS